jgi:hypothetical protein
MPSSTMLDDAINGIGAGIGKPPMTPTARVVPPCPVPVPPSEIGTMALDGNRPVVSAVVGLRDAKRLLKRLETNIALLEEEEGDADEEAANGGGLTCRGDPRHPSPAEGAKLHLLVALARVQRVEIRIAVNAQDHGLAIELHPVL